MRRDHQLFLDRGYDVVAVGLGSVQRAARFRSELHLPFVVLADRNQHGYRTYGLGRGSVTDIVNPKMIVRSARAFASGARQGKSAGDPGQLPGTFVINRDGIVQFARPAKIASDLATTFELIEWIDRSAG